MEKQIMIHNSKSGIMQLKIRENNLKCQINKSQSRENAEWAAQQLIVNRLSPDLLCCYRWLEGIQSWKTCDFAILVLN